MYVELRVDKKKFYVFALQPKNKHDILPPVIIMVMHVLVQNMWVCVI